MDETIINPVDLPAENYNGQDLYLINDNNQAVRSSGLDLSAASELTVTDGKPYWGGDRLMQIDKGPTQIFVDGANGNDANDGTTQALAVKTLDRLTQILTDLYNPSLNVDVYFNTFDYSAGFTGAWSIKLASTLSLVRFQPYSMIPATGKACDYGVILPHMFVYTSMTTQLLMYGITIRKAASAYAINCNGGSASVASCRFLISHASNGIIFCTNNAIFSFNALSTTITGQNPGLEWTGTGAASLAYFIRVANGGQIQMLYQQSAAAPLYEMGGFQFTTCINSADRLGGHIDYAFFSHDGAATGPKLNIPAGSWVRGLDLSPGEDTGSVNTYGTTFDQPVTINGFTQEADGLYWTGADGIKKKVTLTDVT